MLISDATARAFDEISARQRDMLRAFTPGALPEHDDVSAAAGEEFTLDPLSVTAPPNSYFITRGDRGTTLFTRDGSFELRDGVLTDRAGNAILGYSTGGSPPAALRADAVDVSLGLVTNPRIEADGSACYDRQSIDPLTGGRDSRRVVFGRIALARIPAGTKLQNVDATHASVPSGVVPHLGTAGDGNFGALRPFSREHSGVDLDLSLDQLEEAYLALDALRAAEDARGGTQKTTMDLLK